jgi:hypothetical protein
MLQPPPTDSDRSRRKTSAVSAHSGDDHASLSFDAAGRPGTPFDALTQEIDNCHGATALGKLLQKKIRRTGTIER